MSAVADDIVVQLVGRESAVDVGVLVGIVVGQIVVAQAHSIAHLVADWDVARGQVAVDLPRSARFASASVRSR